MISGLYNLATSESRVSNVRTRPPVAPKRIGALVCSARLGWPCCSLLGLELMESVGDGDQVRIRVIMFGWYRGLRERRA